MSFPQESFSFIEPFAKTHYSFLKSSSSPEEMVSRASELDYQALGICDTDGLYGLPKAHKALNVRSLDSNIEIVSSPMKLLYGTELSLANPGQSVSILIKNKNGYENLCELISSFKLHSPKGKSNFKVDDLSFFFKDLFIFPQGLWSEEELYRLLCIFNRNCYLPLVLGSSWQEKRITHQSLILAKKLNIKPVLTQRPVFHSKERKPLFDIMTCIANKETLNEAGLNLKSHNNQYLHSNQEISEYFGPLLKFHKNNEDLLEKIDFSLDELSYDYPDPLLPDRQKSSSYLRRCVFKGIRDRNFKLDKSTLNKVKKELKLIRELSYESYFLTLKEICDFASSQGILFQGRGSAANSAVCYFLNLTGVNPQEVDLLFERFLSKERGEPPDIDIDFESSRREEVLQYIYQRYGLRHAAMVCTVNCYKSRMAIREICKVFGIPLENINRLIKYMGREGIRTFTSDSSRSPLDFGILPEKFEMILKYANELIGTPRHIGIHTGGFVISKSPLIKTAPIEKASMENRYVVQWDKEDLEYLGFLKIDFLGLGMLGALSTCFKLLKAHKSLDLSMYSIPREDKKTFDLIGKGKTLGVFQIESRAQMNLVVKLKPRNYYDLVIQIAIVRPGPIQGGMIHPFLKRRMGLEEVDYLHPKLEGILKKTHGVPIFQEQVMQISTTLADFTPGEADELRRIMSNTWKRTNDSMNIIKNRLTAGFIENGLDEAAAERIFSMIKGFSSYGFPESHSASFAHICYASCYLKFHYPAYFTCALLNNQPMGFYSPRSLIHEAQAFGVKVLPLEINHSDFDYTIENEDDLRVGFRSVYGLSQKEFEIIKSGRPYQSIQDFLNRVPIQKRSLRKIAGAGAFKNFELSYRKALWQIESFMQTPFSFGEFPSEKPKLPGENSFEEVSRYYKNQGFHIDKHPVQLLRPSQGYFKTSKDLFTQRLNSKITIYGMLSVHQRPPTAKGVSFLTLEDEFGLFNANLMPKTYKRYREELLYYSFFKVTGILETNQDILNIKVLYLEGLSQFKETISRREFH